MKIILLGMPGAGKGTQAELIKVNYSIPSISTGAILRDIGKTNSGLGAKVQNYLQSGRLVPDEIIIEILVNRISEDDCSNGFLLDGFPRNIDQAKALEKASIEIDFVVFLNIEEQELAKLKDVLMKEKFTKDIKFSSNKDEIKEYSNYLILKLGYIKYSDISIKSLPYFGSNPVIVDILNTLAENDV